MLEDPKAAVKKSPEMEDHVRALIERAAYTQDAGDAMKFAQAALNAANAIIGLSDLKA